MTSVMTMAKLTLINHLLSVHVDRLRLKRKLYFYEELTILLHEFTNLDTKVLKKNICIFKSCWFVKPWSRYIYFLLNYLKFKKTQNIYPCNVPNSQGRICSWWSRRWRREKSVITLTWQVLKQNVKGKNYNERKKKAAERD